MYTVLTDRQKDIINKALSAIEVASITVRSILNAAADPASPALEGKKKPGRPRKAKATKSDASSSDLTA